MPQTPARNASKNRVLARLARADLALLRPHLTPVDLPVSTQLETTNARIDSVYFIERGFASVVADGRGKRGIEVGIIGREGLTGLALVLGHARAQPSREELFGYRAIPHWLHPPIGHIAR